jgi:hypothetical protein
MSKIWLAFWEIWRHKNFILRLTDLYYYIQPLVHWRSKKSEKSHKLLSDLSGMVTQFNKISFPVSLFFLQGKFLSMVFFYWIKEYWTFSTLENSHYFLTIVLRNGFDLQTVKTCPHSFLFFFWKINFGLVLKTITLFSSSNNQNESPIFATNILFISFFSIFTRLKFWINIKIHPKMPI